jgi:hypothetical protein
LLEIDGALVNVIAEGEEENAPAILGQHRAGLGRTRPFLGIPWETTSREDRAVLFLSKRSPGFNGPGEDGVFQYTWLL